MKEKGSRLTGVLRFQMLQNRFQVAMIRQNKRGLGGGGAGQDGARASLWGCSLFQSPPTFGTTT